MAKGIELATAYVSLAVETSSISEAIGKGFAGGDKIATKAGRNMGRAMAKGFEQEDPVADLGGLQKDVEAAQSKIAAAQERSGRAQEAAIRKVEIARAELTAAEERGAAGKVAALKAADRLVTAEQKLEAATMQARQESKKLYDELDNAEQALTDAEQAMKNTATASEKSASGMRQAFSGIGSAISKGLDGDFKGAFSTAESAAATAADDVKSKFATAGDAAKTALSGDLRGAFDKIRPAASTAADDVETEFRTAGEPAGSGFMDNFSGALQKGVGLLGGLGIGLSIAEGIGSGMEREKLGDKVAAQLDLSGPAAERAGSVAGSLYSNAYGESLEEVNTAVAAVMSSIPGAMSAGDGALENMTGKAMDLASAFDVDVNESVGAVGILMRNGLANDANEAFDLMVGGMQRVPAGFRDELMPAITEYGKHFGALGMDGEAAMGLLVRGAENGTIGVDKMGDAVKEFQIRATDMSKSTSSVYDTLGLDMQDMTNKLLAGGDSAEDAFGQIVSGLQGIDDPAARAEASIALFGTPLEDLGVDGIPQFLDALNPAAGEMESFAGSAERMGNTLNDNAATKLEAFKRSLTTGFTNVVGTAAGALLDMAGAFKPVLTFLQETAPKWGPFATGIGIVAGAVLLWKGATALLNISLWGQAAAMVAAYAPIVAVIAGIGLLVGAVIYAWQNFDWFRNGVLAVWSGIQAAAGVVINWFTAVAVPIFQAALAVLGAAFSWLNTNVIQPVWSGIRVAVNAVVTWFATTAVPWFQSGLSALGSACAWLYTNVIVPVWAGIRTAIAVAVAVVTTIFQGIVWLVRTTLGPAFSWLYNSIIIPVWNGIKSFISGAWAFIRDWIFTPIRNFIMGPLAGTFRWFYNGLIIPVWNGIKGFISGAWNFIRDWIFTPIRNFINGPLAGTFRWLRDSVIIPVWNGIKGAISGTWNWVRDNVLNPMIGFVKNNVVGAWNTAKAGIDKAWTAIKGIVSKPVDFVINTVINDGFIKNFNKIADKVKIDKLPEVKFNGFARGGVLPGRSSWRNGDDQLVPMRSGEGVYMSEVMSDPYERNRLHGMNDMVRRGMSPEQAREALDRNQDTSRHGVAAHGHAVGPGTQVFGGVDGPSYGNALQHAIARTGVLKVAGLAPSWNVGRAMGMWDGAAGVQVKSGGIGANHVRIQTGNYPDWWWGYYDNNNRIRLNSRTAGGQSSNIKTNIAAHEIGHALGLPHAMGWGKASVMDYGHLQSGGAVTANDIRELQKIYPGGTGQPGEGSSGFFSGMFEEFTKLVDLSKLLSGVPGAGFVPDLLKGAATMMWDGVKKFASSVFHDDSEEGGGEGAGRWAGTVREALGRVGLPTTAPYVDAWLRQIQTESGGNPRAVQGNIGDINNLTGDIAKGLVQVIGSTFQSYRDPELPNDRFNPLASLTAGMRYAKATYGVEGMLRAIGHGSGYARGGIISDRLTPQLFDDGGLIHEGVQLIEHGRRDPDRVLTGQQWRDVSEAVRYVMAAESQGGSQHLHIHGQQFDESRLVRRGVEEMASAFRKVSV